MLYDSFCNLSETSALVSELQFEMNSDPWEHYWGALWGMKEGKSSELYVPLGRNTQDFVKCPVPRFI